MNTLDKESYQAGFNDGYSSAICNAREAGLIPEDQADDLLTELVQEDNVRDPKVTWDYEAGYKQGMEDERNLIGKYLQKYFELTQEPDDEGNVEVNEEWDRGFQAAIAIIRNPYNHRRV